MATEPVPTVTFKVAVATAPALWVMLVAPVVVRLVVVALMSPPRAKPAPCRFTVVAVIAVALSVNAPPAAVFHRRGRISLLCRPTSAVPSNSG